MGRLRHIDTHTLWVQQAVRSGRIDLRKIPGTRNPADLLTKHSATREKLNFLVRLFGCRYEGGRSAAAPALRRDLEGAKRTMANQQALAITEVPEATGEVNTEEWHQTILPHVVYDPNTLDQHFPPLKAADEGVDDEDPEINAEDPIEKEGGRLASCIYEQMRTIGRVRDPGDF